MYYFNYFIWLLPVLLPRLDVVILNLDALMPSGSCSPGVKTAPVFQAKAVGLHK
jgi:hypothetical protein